MTDKHMYISPKYRVRDWLALDLSKESDWEGAVSIIEDRFHGRFFKMVESLDSDDFSGFAILALDCLLIESLQQFRRGVDTTPYKKSGEYFREFLTSGAFSQHFSEDLAKKFYDQFRCGILHQAELKKSSKVHRVGPLVRFSPDGEGLIINRKAFHAQLKKTFGEYLHALRTGADPMLRKNAETKMRFICRQ